MKITKFGHCCLLIEISGKRILTDPGRFSSTQDDVTGINLILITHEHADHLHTESLEKILQKNPQAEVVTNSSVKKILKGLGIECSVLEGTDTDTKAEVFLEAFDGKHVEIIDEYGIVQNTGYFIAETLFYPGDAYSEPNGDVPVLALPVAGPWCKAADAIRYAKAIKPAKAFPVHDAVLSEAGITLIYGLFAEQLKKVGVEFVSLKANESAEF